MDAVEAQNLMNGINFYSKIATKTNETYVKVQSTILRLFFAVSQTSQVSRVRQQQITFVFNNCRHI
jgi:hypothetical protein